MRTIVALINLTRPASSILAGIAASLAVFALDSATPTADMARMFVIFWASFAAGYILNNLFDVAQDRLNHPQRLAILERASRGAAAGLSMALFGLALICAAGVGSVLLGLVSVNIALIGTYSLIKRLNGALGNVLVAFFYVTILIAAGLYHGRIEDLATLMLMLLFYGVAREIVCDIHDAPGDSRAGLWTIATIYGSGKAFAVVWCLLICLGSLLVILTTGWVSGPNLALALLVPYLLMISTLIGYQYRRTESRFRLFRVGGFFVLLLSLPSLWAI